MSMVPKKRVETFRVEDHVTTLTRWVYPAPLTGLQVTELRDVQLDRMCPELWGCRKVAYIGAKRGRIHYYTNFVRPPLIVEAYEPNVIDLLADGYPFVAHADVRTWVPTATFDAVFWWHGPEHIAKHEVSDVLELVESYADKLVVLGCPWGDYPQDAVGGNPYERHLTHFQPEFFADRGYDVDAVGPEGRGSNICAVKRLCPQ